MNCNDIKEHAYKKHPFSFHYKNRTYRGCYFDLTGFKIITNDEQKGEFLFYRQQNLKGAALQIEGETILIAELTICEREVTDEGKLFALSFSSIVEPELEKLKKIYQEI